MLVLGYTPPLDGVSITVTIIMMGDRPSQSYAFVIYANGHGDESLTVVVDGGAAVTGLRRTVLVRDDATLAMATLSEAPPDATSITVGPGCAAGHLDSTPP